MNLENYIDGLLFDARVLTRLPQHGRTTIVTLALCHHAKMTRADVAALLDQMPEKVEPRECYEATCRMLERRGR